jgi:YHS domain-containing protein
MAAPPLTDTSAFHSGTRTSTAAGGSPVPAPAEQLVRDPICGMTFHPDEAAATRIADGVTYHFCAERCARMFDRQRVQRALADGAAAEHAPSGTAVAESRQGGIRPAAQPGAGSAAVGGLGKPQLLAVAACLVVAAAAIAVFGFGVPLGRLATFALVLACPLMHVFMMRGHGAHSGHGAHGGHGSHNGGDGQR